MKRILISCESLVLHQGYEVTGCVTEKLRILREHFKLHVLAGPVSHHIPIQNRFLCLIAIASLTLRLMVLVHCVG